MAVQVSYPGVYIEEFAPGAPIEGVGTSTAAFLGPASAGPLNTPTKITSWDAFRRTYGDAPLAGFYLWYAVRGFYENGGKVCYVSRVSNAANAELVLSDVAGKPTIRLRARDAGAPASDIRVTVDANPPAPAGPAPRLYAPTATIANASGTAVRVSSADDAAKFRSGDYLTWTGSTETTRARVVRVEDDTIRLASALSKTYTSGALRLDDLRAGDTTLRLERVDNPARFGPGSIVKLSLDPGNNAPRVEETQVVSRLDVERVSPSVTTYRVELRQPVAKNFDLTKEVTASPVEFRISVAQDAATRDYNNLSMDPAHPNYYARVIQNDAAGLVLAEPAQPLNTTPAPDNRPQTVAAARPLAGGANDNPSNLTGSDYRRALALLEAVDDVNVVAVPDRTDAEVQLAVVNHCTNMRDRFAILDSEGGANPFGTGGVDVQRRALDTPAGFAALYYPWLTVPAAAGSGTVTVPPSGHVAGIYSRIDNSRGVHKAPAGTEAVVGGALGVERALSDVEQGQLNLQGVNVIRVFASGGRPYVWGARTTSTDANWQYVNTRRLFLFIEESIEESIRWAVFEPNNLQLWQKLRRTITEFLTRVWRDGALFGATAQEAFYVRIDNTLNTPSELALGRLNIEIGLRPSYPAEFIVVRIGIWQGGSETSEQ
jgi:uncharacterized protein